MTQLLRIGIFLLVSLFSFLTEKTFAQKIVRAEYFVDIDPGCGNGTVIPNKYPTDTLSGIFEFKTDTLKHGGHFYNVRFKDTSGHWSPCQKHYFFIEDTIGVGNPDRAEYFIDKDPGTNQGLTIDLNQSKSSYDTLIQIPTDSLKHGNHFVYFRHQLLNSLWSPWQCRMIFVEDTLGMGSVSEVEFFFHSDPGIENGVSIQLNDANRFDTLIAINIDTLGVANTIFGIRQKTRFGYWSPFQKHLIRVEDTLGSNKLTQLEYSIDSALSNPAYVDTINIHPSVDSLNVVLNIKTDTILRLSDHFLNLLLRHENNQTSITVRDTFKVIDCPMLDSVKIKMAGNLCAGDSLLLTEGISAQGIWPSDSFRFNWTINGRSEGNNDTVFVQLKSDTLQISFSFVRNSDSLCAGKTSSTLRIHPNYNDTFHRSICYGDSSFIHGKYEKTSGSYLYRGSSQLGCDSISVAILRVNQTYNDSFYRGICPGDSLQIHGVFRKIAGTYVLNDSTYLGCDSNISIFLSILPVYSKNDTFSICQGDTLRVHGKAYMNAGTFVDSLKSVNGCDSMFRTTLILHPIYRDSIRKAICQGDSLLIHGRFEKVSGKYNFIGKSQKGCDSASIVELEVLPVYHDSSKIFICQGDSTFIHGISISKAGRYIYQGKTNRGCDSISTIQLIVHPAYSQMDTFERCAGDTLRVHAKKYFKDGLFTDTLLTTNGCDSIFLSRLIIRPVYNNVLKVGLCGGDSLFFDGVQRKQTGIYEAMFNSTHGCDSFVRIELTVDSIILTDVFPSICFGDSVSIGGSYRKTKGIYTDFYKARGGCDSLVFRHLSILSQDSTYISDTICSNGQLNFYGQILIKPGQYRADLKNSNGCDSFVFLTLFNRAEDITSLKATICFGDSLFVGNGFKKGSGIFIDTLVNQFGCDSIIQYTQIERPQSDTIIDLTICRGDSVFTGNRYKKSEGLFNDTLINQFGCDSVVITSISFKELSTVRQFDTICFHEVIDFFGQKLEKPGVYQHILTNAAGCDSIIELNLFRRAQFIPKVISFGLDTLGTDTIYNSYIWYRNRVVIPGETKRTIKIVQDGTYDVTVTNQIGCSANSWDEFLNTFEFESEFKFIIYPNPANSFIHVVAPYPSIARIYNVEGKLIVNESLHIGDNQIALSTYKSGVYTLVLQDGNTIVRKKIILVN